MDIVSAIQLRVHRLDQKSKETTHFSSEKHIIVGIRSHSSSKTEFYKMICYSLTLTTTYGFYTTAAIKHTLPEILAETTFTRKGQMLNPF